MFVIDLLWCCLRRSDLVGLVLLGASGCAAGQAAAKQPTSPCSLPVQVRLSATERINPSAGQPLPTRVRLYQLHKMIRLEESDFERVWEQPAEALGNDVVDVQERTLFPSHQEIVDVELSPKTRFVVAMAVYRRPTGTQWRSVMPLPRSEQLCEAYAKAGAPLPALTFRFDMYRVEGRSFLLRAGAGHDLPDDVAPTPAQTAAPSERRSGKGRERAAEVGDGLSDPSAPTTQPSLSAPSVPTAPTAPPVPAVSSF